jgi:hypothetical protein
MKGRLSLVFVVVVLATSVIGMTGVAGAERSPKSSAHAGCRALQVAFIGRSTPMPRFLRLAEKSFEHARAAYRPTAADKSGSRALQAWMARVGALCKGDFPNDGVLQEAHFPKA